MQDMEILQDRVLKKMDLSKEIADAELMEAIRMTLEEYGREKYLSLKEKSGLGKELFNAFRKLDILQELLEDDEITEIMINGTDCIFVEKEGKIVRLGKRFSDRQKLEDIIQQIVSGANRMVNERTPIVDARLQDGSRVNVVLYPVALNGPVVTIRKFSKEKMTMEELIQRDSIDREISVFLKMLMVSGYNVFISGGTGSG